MSWAAALAALDARLAALPSLGTAAVEWVNGGLPVQTALHYRVAFLPASVNPGLGNAPGSDHEQGIYQISIWAPAGDGLGAALTAAQAVSDWFRRQTLAGAVACLVPTLAPPQQEPDWVHIPVSIPFLCL